MTSRERFNALMNFEKCDRSLDWENGIWYSTIKEWSKQGMPPRDPRQQPDTINVTGKIYFSILDDFLGMDEASKAIPVVFKPIPEFERVVHEETDDYLVVQNEWGLIMKIAKSGDTMPHFIESPIKTEVDLEALKERYEPRLSERYPKDWDALLEEYKDRTYPLSANDFPFGFFGFAREMFGVEHLFYAFYDTPELVKKLMNFTADYMISIWEKALVEAKPDFFRVWEDMCYKNTSLISPQMFREFMMEPYKKLTGFIKDCGCKNILVDTDGNCMDLIPLFIEAGVTGLYPFECMSGMDVVEVRRQFPKLQMLGGIDKTALIKGKKAIDEELDYKLSILPLGGYIPHVDHFIPPDVCWDNFLHYRMKTKELLYTNTIR